MRRCYCLLLYLVLFTGCVNEVLKGEVDRAKIRESALAAELDEVRKHVENQDHQNGELLKQQAQFRRDSEVLTLELNQKNAELTAANSVLSAQNEELQRQLKSNEQKTEIQNASWQKTPSVTIIPNNGFYRNELTFKDSRILPPRRQGENLVIELQDDLLFVPDSQTENLELTQDGKKLLEETSQEILRCYRQNIYRIEGHTCRQNAIGQKNEELFRTQQKANLIVQYLMTKFQIPSNQLEVCGCGATRPLVSETTETNRQRNRRIEWVIRPEYWIKENTENRPVSQTERLTLPRPANIRSVK